jgi:hypothetical protein
MKVFVVPRLLAAKLTTYFRPRPTDHREPEQPSFWILHAR